MNETVSVGTSSITPSLPTCVPSVAPWQQPPPDGWLLPSVQVVAGAFTRQTGHLETERRVLRGPWEVRSAALGACRSRRGEESRHDAEGCD